MHENYGLIIIGYIDYGQTKIKNTFEIEKTTDDSLAYTKSIYALS